MTKHYIFGYGSLILKESRDKTGVSKIAFPARISGYKRVWGDRHEEETYLAVKENLQSFCNGVILGVPEDELEKFDDREVNASRKPIEKRNIERLDGYELPEGNYWIYIPRRVQVASEKYVIPQSYLDVVLTGCLEIGEDFAEEFIKSTEGWTLITNDRDDPIYPRALNDVKYKEKIDGLIEGL